MEFEVPPPDPRLRGFERIYLRHRDDLLRYALRRTGGADEAADVVADTFLVAWNRAAELPDDDSLRPWLFGVARNVLANRARGERRRTRLAERLRGELAVTEAVPPADPGMVDIGRVFRTLPDLDREVLALTAWEGLDPAGVARALGCSRATARVRLHRARRRFARALRAAGLTPAGTVLTPAHATAD
ncbi:RNA polymerase sigma factor [Nocardiopsis trehalosi]|uniref:RNA polymerase sigma factor n=1 Tax=Nocardiopsis trehalosi TaxID=109329 RepID=UPI00082999F3|nr:sigma-70 family RNA polymerase sigma factor [Nocardiopsis trehalosi]